MSPALFILKEIMPLMGKISKTLREEKEPISCDFLSHISHKIY